MTYSMRFTVPATSYLEAVTRAVGMLRSGVRFIAVLSAHDTGQFQLWDVSLKVAEDA